MWTPTKRMPLPTKRSDLPVLREVKAEEPVRFDEVERVFASAKDRHLLLLLTEHSRAIPKVKPGIPVLAYRVLDSLTEANGPLDEVLQDFSRQRSRLIYRRWLVDRNDTRLLTRIGVCWLPQVRIVRNGNLLFRSSVAMGDNGQFLAQDVGGKSFVRRLPASPSSFVNLVDALSAELDRPTRK